jgi:hypothetical protein
MFLLFVIEDQFGYSWVFNGHFSWIGFYVNVTSVILWTKLINWSFRMSRLAAQIKRERKDD